MASQKGLGKGLGALLGDFSVESHENTPYKLLPIYKIEPNPGQPGRILTSWSWKRCPNPLRSTASFSR